jgi:hypothetical protein
MLLIEVQEIIDLYESADPRMYVEEEALHMAKILKTIYKAWAKDRYPNDTESGRAIDAAWGTFREKRTTR